MTTLYTTEDADKAVLAGGNDVRPNRDLRPYVRAASVIVRNWLALCTAKGVSAPASEDVAEVAAWLGAWSYKNSDQQYATSNTGRSSASFKGQTGMGLDSNHYGQQAKAMDGTGLLAQAASGQRASAAWLGRTPSDQTDYVDRDRGE